MMQRPIMEPMFLEDEVTRPDATPSKWKAVVCAVGRAGRLLLVDVLHRRCANYAAPAAPLVRVVRAMFYRLTYVPVVLCLAVATLVITATHPHVAPAVVPPAGLGAYFEPVHFQACDGVHLDGWLVPVVDARRVLAEGDDMLHRRYPAIVLVHDFAQSRQQVLPLVMPLHEAGYVVLALDLRGNSTDSAASTFGIKEALDVSAAVEFLRQRRMVDPEAVGVLGIGSGATAALLATKQDHHLRVLVLDHPLRQFDHVLSQRIGPRAAWIAWMRPLCKWAFELGYGVDAEAVDLEQFGNFMRASPVLLMDEPAENESCLKPHRQRQVIEFLKSHLVARRTRTVLLPRQDSRAVSIKELDPSPAWPPQRPAEDIVERNASK